MDLSKLPRMSQTKRPGEAGAGQGPEDVSQSDGAFCTSCGARLAEGVRFCGSCGGAVGGASAANERPAVAVEAPLSLVVAAFVLLLYRRLWQYIFHRLFGTFFNPFIDTRTGKEVAYTTTPEFWSDLGIGIFAVSLLLAGLLVICSRRPIALIAALGVTGISVAYNLVYLLMHLTPLPFVSALAVAFGGYLMVCQFNLLRASRS